MKNIIQILIIILSTVMFSSKSYSEWTVTFEIGGGKATHYLDFDRVRKSDDYVYWWNLIDLKKPNNGFFSMMGYNQGDCKMYRVKLLSLMIYKKNMGRGEGERRSGTNIWQYPIPNSANENSLKKLCDK